MGASNSQSGPKIEDLGEALALADVRNTPITSRMKKGEELKDMEYSWPVDNMGKRRKGGIPENKDVDVFEGDAPAAKVRNRAERWWRTPRVTVIAEKVNKTTPETVRRTFLKQKAKFTKEQKRDIEAEICSDQESGEDIGTKGSITKGLGRVINDGTLPFTDVPMTIPKNVRTPSAQIYTGTLANLGEDTVTAMMQARWEKTGAAAEFTLFVASSLKNHISLNFGRYVPNKIGYTVIVRTNRADIDREKLTLTGVDVIEGDFGMFDVDLVPFMPTNMRGYGLEMDQLSIRPLMMCDFTELPYQGGGRSGLIDSILGYEFGDPRSHFKIAPSDEQANDLDAGGVLED